jgi:hypothetical protein
VLTDFAGDRPRHRHDRAFGLQRTPLVSVASMLAGEVGPRGSTQAAQTAETTAAALAVPGIGRSADPASRPPLPLRQLRSIEREMPSSLAIWLNGRPLLASRAIASCLNSSAK